MGYENYALIKKSTLTDIGDAIRTHTGDTELIDPAEFANLIEGIESGDSFTNESGITTTRINGLKVIDMALTKTGIAANQEILQWVYDSLLNTLQETATSYQTYCETNSLELNEESKTAFISSDSYTDSVITSWAWSSQTFFDLVNGSSPLTLDDSDLCLLLVNNTVCVSGMTYTIDDEKVELIRTTFDKYVEENEEYYYIQTLGPDTFNPLWFASKNCYDDFINYIKQTNYIHNVQLHSGQGGQTYTLDGSTSKSVTNRYTLMRIENGLHLSKSGGSIPDLHNYYVEGYNDSWDDWNYYSIDVDYDNSMNVVHTDSEFDNLIQSSGLSLKKFSIVESKIGEGAGDTAIIPIGLVTNDGRKMKVFKNVNAMKSHSIGRQSYYDSILSYNYNGNDNNTISFNGEYYTEYRNTYSHNIIQTAIDNTETLTEEVVNAIVNEQMINIIANYGNNDSYLLQEKTVKENGVVIADEGYYGLGMVIVDVDFNASVNGYVANFYDENNNIIQTLTATSGLSIRPPEYTCDAWFDDDGHVVIFPFALTKPTNFYAVSNPTYADLLYSHFKVDKEIYPYICTYGYEHSSGNTIGFAFMKSNANYDNDKFTSTDMFYFRDNCNGYIDSVENFVNAVINNFDSDDLIYYTNDTITRNPDYFGYPNTYVYTNFENPGYSTNEHCLRLDIPYETVVDGEADLENGFTVNFYDHDKVLIESHTAKCGNQINSPLSLSTRWEDIDGTVYTFPMTSDVDGDVINLYASTVETT